MKAKVYSKVKCPYCVKAIELLESKGHEIEKLTVNEDISVDDFKEVVYQKTGSVPQTVPQIFINDEYIGGHDDLVSHFANLDCKSNETEDLDLSDIQL